MTDEQKNIVLEMLAWYEAFRRRGKGDERSVKAFLEAADLIEHLSSVAEKSSAKAALCEKVMEDYDKMRRERDAAVADLKDALDRGDAASFCEFCKHNDYYGKCEHPCNPYSGETGWEWRGLPKEE